MSKGTVLLILVASAESGSPSTRALQQAAEQALGPSARVQVEAVQHSTGDEDVLRLAARADGVVELSWDEQRGVATLHCYLTQEERWVNRTITFRAGDPDTERGRMLGFALASMLNEHSAPLAPVVEDEPDAPPTPASVKDHPAAPRANHRYAFELSGRGTQGIGGAANGLGLSAALERRWGSLWPRAEVGARVGEIEAAQATTRRLALSLGLAWRPIQANEAWAFGMVLRIQALGGWLQVSHLSEDDVRPQRRARWFAGGEALAGGELGVSGSSSIFGGLGLEAIAGRTLIYTHGRNVAVVPILRVIGELGARTRF